jgi:hypothetical protein
VRYLREVRRLRGSGAATAEQSYYPAVHTLLNAAAAAGTVRRGVLAHPAGLDGSFPDVAIYEPVANVLVLPVEVKPSSGTIDALLRSRQAETYAQVFGGGTVLVTNLWQWALARVDSTGRLREERRVRLVESESDLDSRTPTPLPNALADLALLIESGSNVRGNYSKPYTVAKLLAYHAANMRDAINAAGKPTQLLSTIREALARGLNIELSDEALAPTVVQTLVYGQFAAWLGVEDPHHYDWMQASYRLHVPVFAEILHEALRPALVRRCDLTAHLDAVARVLRWTDRDSFETAFDGDAIQYFYEPFLEKFDRDLRDALGVWYTPPAIAAYQVARSNFHLVHDLGIADGLADPAAYTLDPAVGTGTYLIEVCKHIYQHHKANGEPDRIAAERTRDAVVSRLVGFEILPAAFIICHLHVARFLARIGAPLGPDDRARIYLTNSLTGWDKDKSPEGFTLFPELESELRDAATAKHIDPMLVVLGNPPYQGYSTAESDEEKAMLQPWAAALSTTWGLRKHRLNDLYVRFWRVAIERIVNLTDRGVVSFISNRKWLGGRSYPSMRQEVTEKFNDIWIDDLHGDVHDRTHPGDESAFKTAMAPGIRVGTAIVTAVRHAPPAGVAVAHVRDYRGSAELKRHRLAIRAERKLFTSGYSQVALTQAGRFRFVSDLAADYPALDEYLSFFVSGVQPVRDDAVLDSDRAALHARMRDFFDASITTADLAARHAGFGVTRKRFDLDRTRSRLLERSRFDEKKIVRYLFRPMDTRYLYWETEAKLLNEPRRVLFPYWRNVPDQICLVCAQTSRRSGAARPSAGTAVAAFAAADPDARVFPLYNPKTHLLGEESGELQLETEEDAPPTTVAAEWVAAVRHALPKLDDKAAGETIFYAVLAVMHSPDWLATLPVDLDDFPQLPVPADPTALAGAAATGRRLAALLDPDHEVDGVTQGLLRPELADIAVPSAAQGTVPILYGSASRQAGRFENGTVYWSQTGCWSNVPDDVWHFSIGGFQVLPKWLSYRMGGLTAADRTTFRKLAQRIKAILDLAPECDEAYAAAEADPLLAEQLAAVGV